MDSLQSILARLTALRHRALGLTLGAGAVLALATGLGLALLWVACEALLFLSPAWRLTGGVFVLFAAGTVSALFLRRTLPVVLSQHRFALFVEKRYPQLGQRLISALELSAAEGPVHQSPELLAAATQRAAELLRETTAGQILDRRPLVAHLRLLGATTVLTCVCFALFYSDLTAAAGRCATPLTTYEQPPRTLIEIHPGDLEVVKGEDATLHIYFAAHKPRLARIMRRPNPDTPWQDETLIALTRYATLSAKCCALSTMPSPPTTADRPNIRSA